MDYKFIELKVEKNIATLVLARTESLNALSLAFTAEITEAVRELNAMDEARVIILKSNAKAFCAGLDLKDISSMGLDGKAKTNVKSLLSRLSTVCVLAAGSILFRPVIFVYVRKTQLFP